MAFFTSIKSSPLILRSIYMTFSFIRDMSSMFWLGSFFVFSFPVRYRILLPLKELGEEGIATSGRSLEF